MRVNMAKACVFTLGPSLDASSSLRDPAGVQGTLHRISAMRNRKGTIVGLTCRVGRAVTGHIDMIRDLLDGATHSTCRTRCLLG